MKRDTPSLTAEGIAILRALESRKSPGERLINDPYARHFVRPWLLQIMRFFIAIGYPEWRGPGVQGFLLARARYIDDFLLACLDRGLQQLVILGAGYDARAYRFEQLKGRVKVFEVDHPATQRVKLDKLRQVFGALPDHVVYVPIDFDRQSLKERLYESGYSPNSKTLFIWEGVTYYLTPEAVDGTLAFVLENAAPGSWIIFDYTFTAVIDGTYKRGEASSMRRYRGLTGEGMVFGIPEGTIETFLSQRGFREVHNASGEDLQTLYFSGQDRRTVAPVYAIVHATV